MDVNNDEKNFKKMVGGEKIFNFFKKMKKQK